MPHPRRLAGLFSALLAIACLIALPASADAAVTLPAAPNSALDSVENTAGNRVSAAAVKTVRNTVDTASRAPRPTPSAATSPAPQPAQQVVAPVAAAAERAVPSTTSVVHEAQRRLHVRAGAARIARGASAERPAAGSAASAGGLESARPAAAELSPAAKAAARRSTPTATAARPAATPFSAAPEQGTGFGAAAPASGPSASFLFGGGLALLVSALLLTAGPRLRRHLAMPSVVCRPAAFIAVLERPG